MALADLVEPERVPALAVDLLDGAGALDAQGPQCLRGAPAFCFRSAQFLFRLPDAGLGFGDLRFQFIQAVPFRLQGGNEAGNLRRMRCRTLLDFGTPGSGPLARGYDLLEPQFASAGIVPRFVSEIPQVRGVAVEDLLPRLGCRAGQLGAGEPCPVPGDLPAQAIDLCAPAEEAGVIFLRSEAAPQAAEKIHPFASGGHQPDGLRNPA